MKTKIILLIGLVLCLAFAAAAQQESRVKSKSNITNNRASVEQDLTANEKLAWKNLVDKKYDDFAKMFAEDYEGVYDYETTTKTTEMAELKTVTFNSADVSDVKVRFIDEDSAIVTSTVKFTMTMPDGKTMSDNVRATTVWAKRGKTWLVVYHSHVTIKAAMKM
jgi:ketosteroid isomerase-like protein